MLVSNKRSQYTLAKIMHWFIAIMVLLMLMTGWRTADFPVEDKEWVIMIHTGLGSTIFLVMMFRWWWRKSNNLYSPPGWQKKPAMLIPWLFYPLLILHPLVGLMQAAFIDYEVLAFGFINYSAIAADDGQISGIFNQLHAVTAVLLILVFLCHVIEKSRKFFIDDSNSMQE
jgi:cytochrome b561